MNTSSLLSLRRSPHHSPVTSSSAPVTHSITQYKRDTAEHQKRYTAIWLYALFCIAYHKSFLKLFRSSCSISLIFSLKAISFNEIRMLIFYLYQFFACRSQDLGTRQQVPENVTMFQAKRGCLLHYGYSTVYICCVQSIQTLKP